MSATHWKDHGSSVIRSVDLNDGRGLIALGDEVVAGRVVGEVMAITRQKFGSYSLSISTPGGMLYRDATDVVPLHHERNTGMATTHEQKIEQTITELEDALAKARTSLQLAKRAYPGPGSYRFSVTYAGTQKEYIHVVQIVDLGRVYVTGFEGPQSWSELLEWADHQRERKAEVSNLVRLIWDRISKVRL